MQKIIKRPDRLHRPAPEESSQHAKGKELLPPEERGSAKAAEEGIQQEEVFYRLRARGGSGNERRAAGNFRKALSR